MIDFGILQKEMGSKALQEVVRSLVETVNEVKGRDISYQQANSEIVGCKHIIQSLALDWAYHNRVKEIKKIVKK